jgi:hypothetical protein
MGPRAPPPKNAIAASLSAVVSVSILPVPHDGRWALPLQPTMLAGAGAAQCAIALLPTMLAVAGATVFAPALHPTMLAGAGAAQLALGNR